MTRRMPLVGGEGEKEERQPTNISAVAPLVKEAFPLVSACSYSLPLLTVCSTQKTGEQRHTPMCSQYQTPEASILKDLKCELYLLVLLY